MRHHQRRWPGGDNPTVAEVFAEEQPRLLPPSLHPFPTDRIETVRSAKSIYVRFDLEASGRSRRSLERRLRMSGIKSSASSRVIRQVERAERNRSSRKLLKQALICADVHHEGVGPRSVRTGLNRMWIRIVFMLFAWLVAAMALGTLIGKLIALGGIRAAELEATENDLLDSLNRLSDTVAGAQGNAGASSTKESTVLTAKDLA